MKNTLDDRYVRVDDHVARSEGVEFTPQLRSVLSQLEQPKSALEMASALKISLDDAQGAFRRLFKGKLIRPHVVDWKENDAPGAAAPASSAPLPPVTPKTVAPSITAASPSPAPANTSAAPKLGTVPTSAAKPGALAATPAATSTPTVSTAPQPIVFLRIASERASKVTPTPVVSLRLSNQPASAPGDSSPPWRLRPILDAINAKAGGGIPGQLLVYKVFLQLPPDLLKAAGVESLNAVNDKVVVTDPRLRAALAAAARQHANLDAAALGVS